jgi:hypothetical protein
MNSRRTSSDLRDTRVPVNGSHRETRNRPLAAARILGPRGAGAVSLVVVLLALALEPASAGPMSPSPRPHSNARLTHTSARANVPVRLTPAQLRREYLVAAHLGKVRGRALYETALKDSWLNILYQNKPNLDKTTARQTLDEMWRSYQQEARDPTGMGAELRSDLELQTAVLDAAMKAVPKALAKLKLTLKPQDVFGVLEPFLKKWDVDWQKKFLNELDNEERLSLEGKFGSDAAGFDEHIADDLVQYAADAETNERYREARQELIGTDTGVPLTASIERLRQELAVGQQEILRYVRSEEARRKAEEALSSPTPGRHPRSRSSMR